MKFDGLKNREEWVSLVLALVSVGLGVLILMKVSGYYVAQARAGDIVRTAIENDAPDAEKTKERLAKGKEVAGALKGRNLFAPPVPKTNPVNSVEGIIGDEAIIGGKLYKVGAKIGDAKIVKIDPTRVTVEWEGQTKVFSPITGASSGSGGPGGPDRGRTSSRGGGGSSGVKPTGGGGSAEVRAQGGPAAPEGMDRFRGGEDMRARFESMSESERDEFRARMRERMMGGGGMRGGPGGDRGGGFGGDRGGGRGGPGGGRGGR